MLKVVSKIDGVPQVVVIGEKTVLVFLALLSGTALVGRPVFENQLSL